ncbi:unnamed protein product [Dibothriocephalus latus]|uniref:FAR1 domain-containing protein n=1 Tax=Dibothriocephalus latus TaxID=60516 RepID=A0A3P7LMZ4_DIBLA|nr:unnamed protein product [Dibothriocephalus latus]
MRYVCIHGGIKRGESLSSRTLKFDCPAYFEVRYQPEKGLIVKKHYMWHNHETDPLLARHYAINRKLNPEEKGFLKILLRHDRLSNQEVVDEFHTKFDKVLTSRDVARYKYIMKKNGDLSCTAAISEVKCETVHDNQSIPLSEKQETWRVLTENVRLMLEDFNDEQFRGLLSQVEGFCRAVKAGKYGEVQQSEFAICVEENNY